MGRPVTLGPQEVALILISNDVLVKSDAIVLLEGDDDNRCQAAAKLHLDGFAPKIVFSGGVTNHAYGSRPLNEVMPTLRLCGVLESSVINESTSRNT
ncbi:MAG: YdcF family protein, partial [Bacteroidetes bacterium]|nr:YdcF family protein [Bacteroidota bacterium]